MLRMSRVVRLEVTKRRRLGHPDSPPLPVHMLPRLVDCSVEDVVRFELALARDVALG